MDERDSYCPYLLSSKTTAKGTGLVEAAGKEDPVELDSSAVKRHERCRAGGRLGVGLAVWGNPPTGLLALSEIPELNAVIMREVCIKSLKMLGCEAGDQS